ncbi:MAG TPA: pseudouridine synthase [Spirochaetota bacterium]|nr:pseudouridine synthase [Spirochaetota bacterium]HPV42944.1 pseudouridine synthase [Spirochaetota bacterium]
MKTRLNKFLSQSGLGSRRAVEELITSGRITINGKRVTALGSLVEDGDKVALDGSPVRPLEQRYYLILNKPRGYITTVTDDRNRPTVMDLVPEKYRRNGVFPVGRLDRDTSGLLLLTNDGDLAFRLTKPRFHVAKEYIAELDRPLDEADIMKIRKGIYLPQLGLKTRPAQVECIEESRPLVRVILTEGKNRQIRYTFQNLGYRVRSLERTSYGNLSMKRLKKGEHRHLTDAEVRLLKKTAGM